MYAPAATTEAHPPRVSRKGNALLKPAGGPPALTKRHLAFIRFMVFGIDRAFPRWPDVQPHTQLDTNTAADIAGIRRKNARDLWNWPIFVTEYNRQVAALRAGEHHRNITRMIEVRDAPGQGKAADRKVQLQGAMALEGELGAKTNINVTTNIGNQVVAGVVIDLTDYDDLPDARTIEHENA